MWEDPIVAEVRAIRGELAAKFGFDVKAIFADLRKRQGTLGGRLIPQKNPPNQTPQPTGTAIPVSPDTQSSPATPAAEL